MDTQSLIATLNSTTITDEPSRTALLNAAHALIARLEKPWERIYYLSLIQPVFLASLKTAKDLNLFHHLSPDSPKTCSQLATLTDSDPALLVRILRILVASQWITETGVDQYVSNAHSEALKDPQGLVNGLEIYYDEGHATATRLPAYFAATNYLNPTAYDSAPWKWINEIPNSDPMTRWQWLETHANNQARHFDSFLSSIRFGQKPLHQIYSFSPHLASYDPCTPFLVDVGGGKGRDISNIATFLQTTTTHPNAPLILQDRPEVISSLPSLSPLHKNITYQPHDFFTPNPIKGAKIYFEHSVLHDWPDEEAALILSNIVSAMKPGYSKVLMMERVMPTRASEADLYTTCMDIQMMTNFSALERTEEQWRELIEGVGLRFVGVKAAKETYAIIEAEL